MISPFSEDRYEYDAKHLYYLPRECFARLIRPKPAYLIGTRGSGKTTLLKALNWQERLENESLLQQLGGEPFREQYIGCYLKLPRLLLKSFEKWLDQVDEDARGLIFGFYLDLVFVELLAVAVSTLLARGQITVKPETESDLTSMWFEDSPELAALANAGEIRSVSSFHISLRSLRRELEKSARVRSPVKDVVGRYPLEQIGTFSTSVARRMASLCDTDRSVNNERKWHFKVCMDEGECLSRFQQKVMNTFVRLAEWPLFPIVSYVGRPDDISTTLVSSLSHQKADRQLIVIDEMERSEFLELAEGVATVRCKEALNDQGVSFKARQVLGTLSINGLLQHLIDRSEGQTGMNLINSANSFAAESSVRIKSKADELPIYQAYLAEQLDLAATEAGSRAEERRQESTQYRKKMVAAYLSICRLLKVRHIPFASTEMLLGTSDNCVRDCLSQLDHLFRQSGLDLPSFINGELSWEVQASAIRAASEEKRDSIPESGVLAPVETGRLIKGLATITAAIQAVSEDGRHLRSTERGLFRLVGTEDRPGDAENAITLIRDAADAGFLRLQKRGDDIKHFRVHASLAPAYGFSYRGAYYEVRIDLEDFKSLQSAKTQEDLRRITNAIVGRIERQPEGDSKPIIDEPPLPLFPNEDD